MASSRVPRRQQLVLPDTDEMGVDGTVVMLAVDLGTKTLAASWRCARSGDQPTLTDIHELFSNRTDYSVPQIIAFANEDGRRTLKERLLWGHDALDALARGQAPYEHAITLWKLLFYDDYATSETVAQVQGQLRSLDITTEQLVEWYLEAVIKYLKGAMRDASPGLGFMGRAVDTYPMRLYVTVPALFESPENHIIATIISRVAAVAGIAESELVIESECAAASYANAIKLSPPDYHMSGKPFLLLDIGGGTGDSHPLAFDSATSDGAKRKLRTGGKPKSTSCGSELLNELFRTFLRREGMKKAGSFAAQCRRMHISEVACLHIASERFEEEKKNFLAGGRSVQFIVPGGDNAEESIWIVVIPNAEMQALFDKVISKITDHLEQALRENDGITIVVLTGGFARCQYLIQVLGEWCSAWEVLLRSMPQVAQASHQPVARGALLLYAGIRSGNVNINESFGVSQVDNYDRTVHTDATRANRRVMTDPFDSSAIVYERWLPLSQPAGAWMTNDQGKVRYSSEIWQTFTVTQFEKNLFIQIYWSKEPVQRSKPMRTNLGTINDPLVPGIKKWGAPLQFPMDRENTLRPLGYRAERGDIYQAWTWEFYGRVVLKVDGANVTAELQIPHRPNAPKWDEENKHLDTTGTLIGRDIVRTIAQADFNSFALSQT